MKNIITDIVVYGSIVAGIMLFTKPGGSGPALVSKTVNGYTGLVQAETGQKVTVS